MERIVGWVNITVQNNEVSKVNGNCLKGEIWKEYILDYFFANKISFLPYGILLKMLIHTITGKNNVLGIILTNTVENASCIKPPSNRAAYLGGGLDGSPVLEQQLHHLDPVLLARDVQRREPVL